LEVWRRAKGVGGVAATRLGQTDLDLDEITEKLAHNWDP
jgi:hypothetical protein